MKRNDNIRGAGAQMSAIYNFTCVHSTYSYNCHAFAKAHTVLVGEEATLNVCNLCIFFCQTGLEWTHIDGFRAKCKALGISILFSPANIYTTQQQQPPSPHDHLHALLVRLLARLTGYRWGPRSFLRRIFFCIFHIYFSRVFCQFLGSNLQFVTVVSQIWSCFLKSLLIYKVVSLTQRWLAS